jgi:predicted site-specific integrase-resolvase
MAKTTKSTWITDKTFGEMTDLSVQTLRNWRHLGRGPCYFKLGRSVRYALEDVQKFLEQRRILTHDE